MVIANRMQRCVTQARLFFEFRSRWSLHTKESKMLGRSKVCPEQVLRIHSKFKVYKRHPVVRGHVFRKFFYSAKPSRGKPQGE